MLPGRYALLLGFPGRIRVFVTPGESGPLHIVISLKTSDLSVDVTEIRENHNVVAMLSPADPYLTLRGSSFLNRISGHHTQFRFTPPGTYRLFMVDSEFQKDLAFSAAVRNALEHQATAVQMREDGETEITATYLAAEIVKQAISHAGDANISAVAIPDGAAENHAIRSRGRLEIPQTWECAAPRDLWHEAVNSELRYIVPSNNSLLSVVGQESVGYACCASARLSSTDRRRSLLGVLD